MPWWTPFEKLGYQQQIGDRMHYFVSERDTIPLCGFSVRTPTNWKKEKVKCCEQCLEKAKNKQVEIGENAADSSGREY